MKLAIIGGGPAGLVASIIAARNHHEVYVFERNKDVGKKLLLTGNGRCNFLSAKEGIEYYHSSNKELIPKIINQNNLERVNAFFASLGVVSKEKNDCIYPYSATSTCIKSSLYTEAKLQGVNFLCNELIHDIKEKDEGFLINDIYFDKVIIATGSKCAPKTGSDGTGYTLAQKFHHTITDINPSLVQLVSDLSISKDLAGKRCDAIVSHYEAGVCKKREEGEIQFTNYGLSGICIFNLSRDIRIGLNKNKKEEVHINFLPWLNSNILEYLNKRAKDLSNRSLVELAEGFLDYGIVYALCKYNHLNPDKSWDDLEFQEKEIFSKTLVDFTVEIVDTKTFDESQTCSGGIKLDEINLETMESLKKKNLYFAGEIIDIDGDCGGFNLTLCWITGMIAGEVHD